MNRVMIFLLFIFIIIGCDKKDERVEYDKKVQDEINSGVRNDTIFLGYTFGMTKKQYEKKTKELYRKGILYPNKYNYYAYEMNLEKGPLGKAEATFAPTYFKDKLYKLGVAVKTKGEFTTSLTPALLQIMLVNLFAEKYGHDFIKQKGLLKGEEDYILIQGNREIKIIETIGEARIFYTDLLVQKEFNKSQDEESQKKINKTKSNL